MEVLKPRAEWSDVERKSTQAIAKALNTIFAGVDEEQFKLISTCIFAKKSSDTLQTMHDGTSTVRISKLQMMTMVQGTKNARG